MRRATGIAVLVSGIVVFAAATSGVDRQLAGAATGAGRDQQATAASVVAGDGTSLDATISRAQRRLEEVPGDWTTWADLGVAAVEQARVTADPSWYERAEGALEESLSRHPEDNDAAMAGMAALDNARHDFVAAADWSRRALAINSANPTAWGALADAQVQLGNYDQASDAVQQMLDLRPGLASLTRASYDLELHGDLDGATATLQRALATTSSDAGAAWVHEHLGLLAFNSGDLGRAREHYVDGLALVPRDPALLAGLARVDAARGEVDAAVRTWDAVVAARPLPEYLAEYATYLVSLGREDEAAQQFGVLDAVQQLFAESGVADDLAGAYHEADHGDPDVAVDLAEQERARRTNVDSADALAWALHRAGRDHEALPLAREATSLGGRNATFLYHRGMIEQALGMDRQARRHLSLALDTNPWFSPLHAPRAQRALDELGEA